MCIGSERNPSKHSQMRRSLSTAFSTKALSEQESIVVKNIDGFVDMVAQTGGPNTEGLNMTKWYEMLAFDILGDMAFGESFHCIENRKPASMCGSCPYSMWRGEAEHRGIYQGSLISGRS